LVDDMSKSVARARARVASGSSSVAATLARTVRSAAQAGSTGGVRGGCRELTGPDLVRAGRGRKRDLVDGCGFAVAAGAPGGTLARWAAMRRTCSAARRAAVACGAVLVLPQPGSPE
jgi:hypothetical protein